ITPKYYATRVQPFTASFAIQLRNSFYESSMDYTGGTWLKTPLSLWVYGYSRAPNAYTRWAYASPVTMTADHWKGGLASAYLQPDSDEAKAWRHILRNWTGFYGPGATQFAYANMLGYPDNYLSTDPTAPAADPNTTLPRSRNLTVSDSQANGEGTGLVISRTGWLADSSIFEIHALSNLKFANLWANSYAGDPASYKVFKRHYLLAEDAGKGIQPTFSAYCGPNEQSNFMRIGPYGTTSPTLLQRANFKAQIQYVKTPRYWNDPGNAATYAMVDYAGAYQTAAQITFAHRHFAHFKKPGKSEYIIAADAVRTSGGQHKITFLHYPNNGQAGWFENGKTPWPANGTEGNTVVTGDSIVSSAPASRILTKVLRPGGATSLRVYTDNPDGSYTGAVDPAKGPLGGAGQTFRVSICASADGATCDVSNLKTNVLVAHRVVDGTTETANPVELLSAIDPNFIGAQVDDGANSIVAVFPAEDLTLSAAAFTTTHSNAGQYLVSGLTAGIWSISRDGPVITAAAVVDSSGTLYWEGGAGAYVLVRTGAGPLSVATGSLPPALLNGSYYFPLVAEGGVPPYQWSVTSGSLPDGVSLSQAGLLSGTATLSGDFVFTVSVNDSDGQSVTKDLMLTVGTTPLRILTSVLGGGVVGRPYQAALLAGGGVAP
ncbi:MAG: putative Ig domain-containing protein, partial [Desulfobacterales bacterium]|nr:putative Ig domain-containing protein [Desulfobacterales bacterium]